MDLFIDYLEMLIY